MTTPHPNNRTWNDGLLRIVSLSRGQHLDATQNPSMQFLIFHQVNAKIGAKDPSNLSFKQAVRPNQPFRMPLWNTGHIVCIGVDLTQKHADFELILYTRQRIKGELKVSIGYRVQSPLEITQHSDVLTDLWLYCQDAAQRVVGVKSHNDIPIDHVREALLHMNTEKLGLNVVDVVLPYPIFWDPSVAHVDTTIAIEHARAHQSRNVILTQMETDRQRREIIENELARYGIYDIETIADVIAALDKNDLDLARAIHKVKEMRRIRRYEQDEKDRKMIKDLADRDKLDSFNWQDLGQGAIDRLNSGRQEEQQLTGGRMTPTQSYPNYHRGVPQNEPPQLPTSQNQKKTGQLPLLPNPEYTDSTGPTAQGNPHKLIDNGEAPGQAAHAALFDLTHHSGRFLLRYPVTYLGRRPNDNHIVIADDRVSRQHAIIEFQSDMFYIRNHEKMHSNLDTLVNGIKVGSQRIALHDGSEIIIGEARLQFRLQRSGDYSDGNSETRFG